MKCMTYSVCAQYQSGLKGERASSNFTVAKLVISKVLRVKFDLSSDNMKIYITISTNPVYIPKDNSLSMSIYNDSIIDSKIDN